MTATSDKLEYPLQTWKPLHPNLDMHSDTEALWIDGIGYIAQWHCYWDMLYSHGVIYFLRDSLAAHVTQDPSPALTARLATLNSKIEAYERCRCNSSDPPLRT